VRAGEGVWQRRALGLSAKLSLVFFSITLLAIAALYLYLAPGLQTRLIDSKLSQLRATAAARSSYLSTTIGSSMPLSQVRQRMKSISNSTSDRVTVLAVNEVAGHVQLSMLMDSAAGGGSRPAVSSAIALRAIHRRRITTGTVGAGQRMLAEAADPVTAGRPVVAVIVYTAPVADVLNTVSTVRREFLIAGGLALLLALAAGMLVARALARRVKRLERAARELAAGRFGEPIPVDSRDELGQLAAAFNEMQGQLLALEQARKRFIATASHELRTPIFSLGGFVELLEDDDLDPDTRRRFLEQIRDQVKRLGKLSVDLLDLSRLEAGSLELHPEEVDLAELTRAVSGEFEATLALRDDHLDVHLPGGRVAVEASCDPVRVAQIVRILIDNALTHTPAGTQVTVHVGRVNGHVRVAVRDDGEGIPQPAASRIFEPFYTSDDAQGSGLGLAIASELAGRMEGELSVESRAGETTFTLELPA
jgi:two-component system OmpR family sensor kinase